MDIHDEYFFPYGWVVEHQDDQETVAIVYTNLRSPGGRVIIGPHQYGKTSLVLGGFMALTSLHTPQKLQFAIFDPKDVDFRFMEHSAYSFLSVRTPDMFRSAAQRLGEELQRRTDLLVEHQLATWEQYVGDDRLPLIVVYLTELLTFIRAVGKTEVDEFIAELMSCAATLGIRVLIETHSLAYLAPSWRPLVMEYVLGPTLARLEHAYFSTHTTYAEVLKHGAVPASQLSPTETGRFTLVSSTNRGCTLRTVTVAAEYRDQWFAHLEQTITQECYGGTENTTELT
jgi:hypothetical protein